jgi:hypothetical protein
MELDRLVKTLDTYDKVFSFNGTKEAALELRNSILEDPELRPYDKALFISYLDRLSLTKNEQNKNSFWSYALVGLLGAAGGFLARGLLQQFLENFAEDVNKKVLERLKYDRKE